eukprot:128433_1
MTDTALTTYFNILSTPILSNINIRYLNKNVNHLTATQFNVLYSGNDLIVCGRMENMDNDDCIQLDVIVSALTGLGKEEESTWKRIANSKAVKPMRISKRIKIQHNEVNPDANVERIWAYLKLQQFANNRLIHNDMIAMEEDEKQSEQCDALSLAIKHQFVTPWTSMILVQIKEDIALDHTQMDIHPKPISLSTPDAQYGTDAHNDETIPESFSEEREKERLIQCIQELNTISAIDRFLRTHDVLLREEAELQRYHFLCKGSITESMIQNETFLQCKQFIPILNRYRPLQYADFFLPKYTLIWLRTFRLSETMAIYKEYGCNVGVLIDILAGDIAIEAVISSNFEDKLKLLTDPLLTNPDGLPPRKAIIGTIHHQFDQLTDSQHVSLKQASEDIIQTKEGVEVLNMLLSRISIHVRQPFSYSSQSTEMSPGHALDHDRIEYIFSDNGKAFMALLVSLHTYAEFHRLAVCAHLNCFGEWWRSKMRFIATGVEVISTVNTLLSNDYFKINELYSRMGFIATDYQRHAMQNIENYKQIKDKKSMISKLMQHFVPKSIFYGKEIKEMAALEADLEAKLRTMNCTELKSIFNTDISIYNNNAELFHMIRQIAPRSLELSVFRSLIQKQETWWSMTPLQSFSTADAVHWIQTIFDSDKELISIEHLVDIFNAKQIDGAILGKHGVEQDQLLRILREQDPNEHKCNDHEWRRTVEVLHRAIANRLELDRKMRHIKDIDKKYDLEKVRKTLQDMIEHIQQIMKQLEFESIKVRTAQQHLYFLSEQKYWIEPKEERLDKVADELESLYDRYVERNSGLDFKQIAQSLKSLFATLRRIENHHLLSGAAQIFKQIIIKHKMMNDEFEIIDDEAYIVDPGHAHNI